VKLPHPFRLIDLVVIAWSGWFFVVAFQRYQFELFCAMTCGPFWPIELVDEIRRSMDWQTPLLMAIVPLAVLGCWVALRFFLARSRPR
jgi:hypothetical protein